MAHKPKVHSSSRFPMYHVIIAYTHHGIGLLSELKILCNYSFGPFDFHLPRYYLSFLVFCFSIFEGLREFGFAFFRFHMFVTSYNIFLSVNTIL